MNNYCDLILLAGSSSGRGGGKWCKLVGQASTLKTIGHLETAANCPIKVGLEIEPMTWELGDECAVHYAIMYPDMARKIKKNNRKYLNHIL